jgi:hypothetical protein
LGRPPLLSFFLHSSWNSSASAGMGFTILTKNSKIPHSFHIQKYPLKPEEHEAFTYHKFL